MRDSKLAAFASTAVLVALGLLLTPPLAGNEDEADDSLPQRFSARTVNMQGGRGINTLTMEVRRWTTQGEREALLGTLVDEGSEAMTNKLRTMESIGSLRLPNTRPYDLSYARQISMEDGGRQILLATDRPIGGRELYVNARTLEHGVTLIAFDLPADGSRGEGTFIIGADIEIKDDQLSIASASLTPLRLNNVRQTD